jgi:CheY-like chemotaxis protein
MQTATSPDIPVPLILLVDDNEHGNMARRRVLEGLGYRVKTTTSAEKAIGLFSEETFDLVVTDYKMLKMTGVELIAALRAVRPTVPTILLSGFADFLGMTTESTGADVVLAKNVSELPNLTHNVKRLLRPAAPVRAKSAGSQRRRTDASRSA